MQPATPPEQPDLASSPHALAALLRTTPPSGRTRTADGSTKRRERTAQRSALTAEPTPPSDQVPTPLLPQLALADESQPTATGPLGLPLPEPLLFTPEQAGLLLQVPGSWLRKQAAAGKVSSVLLGRRLLFARTDLDALIDVHRRPATGPRRFRSGH